MAKLPLRRREGLMIALLVGISVALLVLRPLILSHVVPRFSATRAVFHFKNGAWTPTPQVPGGPWQLQVSSQGTVWANSGTPGGLCRLDGDRWTHFGSKQFGSHTDRVWGGFALRDQEVWGAIGEGTVRFDGRSWRLYKDALKTNRPYFTVAGSSGVWIVDRDGNLSHFDGSSWTIRSLNEVVPPAAKGSRDHGPFLVMTGDGRLWLSWRGLWRQDGDSWREVRTPGVNLAEVWPIGHDTENVWLWLWRTGEVAAVAPDGRIAARYGAQEMGVTKDARFDELAISNGRIWIASSAGLLAFDGGQWRNQGLPPGCTTMTEVALAPDGSAWVIAGKRSLARVVASYAAALAACMIGLLVSCLLGAMWLRGKVENMLATERAVVAAAGPLPGLDSETGQADLDRHAHWLGWKLYAVIQGFILVGVSVEEIVWRVWPAAPAWAPHTFVLGLAVLVSLGWLRISRRRRSAQANAEQPQLSRFSEGVWVPANWILVVAVLSFGCLVPLDWVYRLVPIAALAKHVRAVLVTIPIMLIFLWRDLGAVLLVGPAFRVGDYDRAIRWIRRLSFAGPTANLLKVEGCIQGLANRPAEAERCLRQAMAKGYASFVSLVSSRSARAGLVGCLGEVLADQGRYEEATRCLQVSLDMGDNGGSARVDLAELLLRQGIEPLKALELVDEAMRVAKGSAAAKAKPSRSATRAWALALLGRRQEAGQAIEAAVQVQRKTIAPLFSKTHLNVGMALLAMEQPEKALEHFRAAYEADPNGESGARALQHITEAQPEA